MKQRRFILVALALLSVSCINVYVTNAPVESRSVVLTAKAEAIAVSNGIDVVVDPTLDRNEAVVTTHSDVIDYVKVYVEDSTLNIKLDAPRRFSTSRLEVRIPRFDYNTLAVSGGAEFSDNDYRSKSLTIAASGGAEVDIAGECKSMIAAASGGAELSLDELSVESANIAASGGAEVDLYVTESLVVNSSGGAEVSYKGNPAKVEASKSGGASIEHDND